MPLAEIAILFLIAALALLVADVFVPSHGILTILALVCLGGMVVTCFHIGQWVGLTAFLACVAATPVGAWAFVKIWPRTWVGRRLVLQEFAPDSAPMPVNPRVSVGDTGRTVSELRPIGEAEFGDVKVDVRSELGIVPAGAKVKVVAITAGLPVVRETVGS